MISLRTTTDYFFFAGAFFAAGFFAAGFFAAAIVTSWLFRRQGMRIIWMSFVSLPIHVFDPGRLGMLQGTPHNRL
jgi:hypothetical protein